MRARSTTNTPATKKCFRWPVRVYYEDTDTTGVVYYANYLRYLERARTEWLAALGFAVTGLENEHGVVFVVHRLQIEYRRPARLGDALDVTVTIIDLGRTRLGVRQDTMRDGDVLTSANVALACVNSVDLRPARIPAVLATRLRGEPIESAP